MSGLFSNPDFVPLAVLGASLLGSGHCVAMCGGLIASSTRSRSDVAFYHSGRLAGYVTLGAIAGAVGERVFQSSVFGILPIFAAWALGSALIFAGVQVWIRKSMHLQLLPSRWLQRLYARSHGSPLLTGLLSAFLPCGWLHTFVLGAVATRSAVLGAVFLFAFWLGTLPALSAAPILFQWVFRPIAQRLPKLSATVLIVAGIACIGIKLRPLAVSSTSSDGQPAMSCHSSNIIGGHH